MKKYLVLILVSLLVAACNIVGTAKEAAKEWWTENGKVVINDASTAAKAYWEAHKDELIASALEKAKAVAAQTLKDANAYTDAKMAAQRDKVVQKLLAHGVKVTDIDTNGDGQVSDDELAAYLEKNPMAWWYTGAAGLLFYGMYLAKQYVKSKLPSATPPSGTAPTA